jgi:hypothetical protein
MVSRPRGWSPFSQVMLAARCPCHDNKERPDHCAWKQALVFIPSSYAKGPRDRNKLSSWYTPQFWGLIY